MSSVIHTLRRRRTQSIQTGPAVSAGQASTVQPPRRPQVQVVRQLVRPTVIVAARTKPNNSALHGARPPIIRVPTVRRQIQPARIVALRCFPQLHGSSQGARPTVAVVRIQQPRRTPQPILRRTVPLPVVQPPLPSRWVPRPQTVRDLYQFGRFRATQVRTQPGRLPSPKMPAAPVVGRWRPGPPPIRPSLFRTRPISPSLTPLPRIAVVRAPILIRRIWPVTAVNLNRSVYQIPRPRPILPSVQSLGRRQPTAPAIRYIVSTSGKITKSQAISPTRPLIIPSPRQPVKVRPAILTSSRAGRILPNIPRPFVVRRPPPARIWPAALTPAARYLLASPALHGPMPRPTVLTRPRLFDFRQSASYKTVAQITPYPTWGANSVNPPIAGSPTLPNDLVAAAIAWLRQQPAIVTAFGDSTTTPKFGSDLAPRNTAPPYLEFFEPEEDESYESADGTGQPSTVCDGQLGMELVGTGKLQVRLLAEQIAAVLNDAPLTFADGVLFYLRRTKRKYPTFTTPGPGANVVLYKRYLEFDYKIERWKPSF